MNMLSAGTVLTLLIASASGTNLMCGWLEGHHHPVLAGVQGLNGPGPVSQSQLPVHGGGSTAPGPGPHDERIGFLGDQQLQPVRHRLGGLTRSLNDVGAVIARGQRRQGRLEGIGWLVRPGFRVGHQLRPFGHHHQPVRPPGGHLFLQPRGHLLQVAGNLGNQHGIGARGDAGLQRQPAGLRSQDFDHGNFPGRLRRLTRLVEHFDGEAEGAVEPKGNQGGGNVILDGPGDAHGVEPFAMELVENGQPLATDDGNQGVNLFRLQPGQQLIGLVHFLHHLVGIDLADMERIHAARLAQHAAGGRIQILNRAGA